MSFVTFRQKAYRELARSSGSIQAEASKGLALYQLLEDDYERFEQEYEERFVRNYGFYRSVVGHVVRGYLKCGDLKDGFARVAITAWRC
ncbi:hypothetical protein ACUUL3_03590 [Thiovibrio sp. JS02]